MLLWHDLNFWTAVGQIGIGVMAGVVVGALLKRISRYMRPPRTRERMCPECGVASLQRVRGSAISHAVSAITGRWSYRCVRCGWPNRRSTPKPTPAPIEIPGLADLQLQPIAELQLHPVEPPRYTRSSSVAEARVQEPRAEASTAPARSTSKDDAALVKDSVHHYVAMLNAGDVTARASCYLSEFTSFGIDGGPLVSDKFERRAPGTGPIQTFDLRCRDLRVYIYKDTAIATGYLVGTITDSNDHPIRVTGRTSWVHLRQNGEWKIAHSHLSPLTPE